MRPYPKGFRPSAETLKKKHLGLPALILGGGPTLPIDVNKSPPESLKIAVNHHAYFCGIDADYMVFCDRRWIQPDLNEAVQQFQGVKISIYQGQSHYALPDDAWYNGTSATLAVWLACYMGCDPVLLCGFNCYQGSRVYCHDDAKKPSDIKHLVNAPLQNHLDVWGPAISRCPNSQAIRAVSGPLITIFGSWQP